MQNQCWQVQPDGIVDIIALALEQWEVTLATKEKSKEHATGRLKNRAKMFCNMIDNNFQGK